MSDFSRYVRKLPPEQQAIRAKCSHTTGTFVEFTKEEVEQSIPQRFERIVRKFPERIAVKTKNNTRTYAELNRAANQVAHTLLAERGDKEEPIVALVDHDANAIATILGVFKTGKTCVPLDPAYHQVRAAHIVEDSRAQLIITNSKNLSLAHELAENARQVINVDDIDATILVDRPGVSISPDTAAYILYTSGSTGQPKGVVQTHRNLLHDVMSFTNSFHICAADRLTLFVSPSGGQGVKTILDAILNGAAVYRWNVKEEGLVNLADWVIAEGISMFNSAPTLCRSFMKTLTGNEEFPKLRLIIVTGEPASASDIELYKKHFSPDCLLVNMFGALEIGRIRVFVIAKETKPAGETVPVGYEIQDNEILLLDANGQEVGSNEIGEIAVRSRYLSPGYWRRPDLTQAKFLPDPDGEERRIYLTGDLGRMMPNGCLEHLGRKDFRVKIRGFSVELEEVEAMIRCHPAVREVVVAARMDESKDSRLIAYIVPEQNHAPTATELRHFLQAKLPEYMTPAAFVFLATLPLSPTGKVDRRALPDPSKSRPKLDTPYVAPRTPIEERLARIWSEVLSLARIGVDDNFFDLGGHSLAATRVVSEVIKTFQLEIPIKSLLQSPTVSEMAAMISGERKARSAVIALRNAGTLPPLYAVPGVFGDALGFAHLVRELGSDQPFYGLQSVGLDGAEAPLDSIEEMARVYVSEIQSVQPHGPYALIGACFGATVAYEMARQLLDAGEEVAFLGLLDPVRSEGNGASEDPASLPRVFERAIASGSLVAGRMRLYIEEMQMLGAGDRINYVARKLRSIGRSVKKDNAFEGIQRELNQIEVCRANHQALHRYHQKALNGRLRSLEIFESVQRDKRSMREAIDWNAFWDGPRRLHPVQSKDSGDMVSGENARVLAALVTERLRAVFGNPSGQETQRGGKKGTF
jgi:amino acid adenylation domain-containing protein